MAGDRTLEELREAEKRAQFEELGRFVQAFEAVLHQMRFACAMFFGSAQRFANIMLHHHALTAIPLFQVMRAMYGELINDPNSKFSEEERGIVNGVLKQVAAEFQRLADQRNALLHGTWAIGSASSLEEELTTLQVHNFKPSPAGLEAMPMPSDIKELAALRARCAEVSKTIVVLVTSVLFRDQSVTSSFVKRDGEWRISDKIQVTVGT